MVVNRIIKWKYIREIDANIIKVYIERYFSNDFISDIHILAPRFENCFRQFFGAGYPTTSIKKSVIQHE